MMRISNTTMHGNSRTNPRGIEIEELPFNCIRRRKNDNPGDVWVFSLLKPSRDGTSGEEGIRLTRPCMKPITSNCFPPIRQLFGPRPAATQTQSAIFDQPRKLISAVLDSVYSKEVAMPKIREEITSHWADCAIPNNNNPRLYEARRGTLKPRAERRNEGEERGER